MLHSSFVPHRPDATGDADGGAGAVEAIPPLSDPAQESKAPQPQSNADAAQDPGKAAFTPEQQTHIDELVAERVKRAEKSARQAALKEAETERQRAEMDEIERVKAEKEESDRRVVEAQAERDRVRNDIEYQVNLRAELEIRELHDRLDDVEGMIARSMPRRELRRANPREVE